MKTKFQNAIGHWMRNVFIRNGHPVYSPVDGNLLEKYNSLRSADARGNLCHAPFKNIYFSHQGKVIACCYNRLHILGEYPKQEIKKIWFGKEANRLRRYIRNNDLSLGCYGCKIHFAAQNFDGIKAKMYDRQRMNRNKFPSVMEFELVNTCNLECTMCNGWFSSSIRKNREKKPPVENVYDAGFVKQLEKFIPYLDEAKFYGGEPFLIDIYYEIWDRITRLNPACRITVQTNATILNNKVKNLLNKGNFMMNISLDSLDKATYEKIRVNAKFDAVMENIRYFMEYTRAKNTFFGISVCPIRTNWRELPGFIPFCNELDAPVYFHTVWYPAHLSLWNLGAAELEEIHETLGSRTFPENSGIQKKNSNHYKDMVKQIESWMNQAKNKEENPNIHNGLARAGASKQKFYERIKEYVYGNQSMNEEAKEKKLHFYYEKINNIISMLPGDYPLEKVLENTNEFMIEVLIAELEIDPEEKIPQRALESGFAS